MSFSADNSINNTFIWNQQNLFPSHLTISLICVNFHIQIIMLYYAIFIFITLHMQGVQYTFKDKQSLDEHHTHFILVDDGSVNEFGKEIELRAKLEKCIGKFCGCAP